MLDLGKLIRERLVRRGSGNGGTLVWRTVGGGREVTSIGYEAHLGAEHGRMRLHYTTTSRSSEDVRRSDYWIELDTTPQPFGGRRWWFVGPLTGRRVAKLYLPPGARTFASRQAYRLSYRSQRQVPHDRALDQAQNLRHRLGSSMSLIDAIPAKLKWMRRRTYDRLVGEESSVGAAPWVRGVSCLLCERTAVPPPTWSS